MINIVQKLVNSSKYSIKCPYGMTAEYITIHNTDNDASAMNEVTYMINNNDKVSYHIAIDDVQGVQGIPFDRMTWNARRWKRRWQHEIYLNRDLLFNEWW